MDLVSFFRIAIPVTLALFCGVVVFSMIGIFVGNTCYVLKNCFKKEKIITEVSKKKEAGIKFDPEREGQIDRSLPRTSYF